MTIKALYPTVRPSLNLDFAKTKALDPRVTFSRASTGTFVGSNGLIQTAASGAARFDHNPATGESLGLLMEEARTNLITYSEQLNNAAWQSISTGTPVVTPNALVAPDGTITSDLVVGDHINTWIANNVGAVNAGQYSFSVWLKSDIAQTADIFMSYGATDVLTYSVTTTWQRFTLTVTRAATAGLYVGINVGNAKNIYIWGAQLEAGSFPTSYIPTVASTVTRAAEVASMTGTNFSSWYRQDQGTIYQSVKLLAASPQDNQYYGATFSAVTDNATKVAHDYSSLGGGPSARTIILSDAGALIATLVILPFNATTRKTASAMQVGSVALAANGQIVTGTATAMPSTVDRMFLSKSGFTPNTTISRFAYYPVRLPDAQLQALTAT
jgi:hypothetical protein